MSAFVLMRHGGLDALEYTTDWPIPKPTGAEVLIKVAACGLNNTDVNTRSGWYSKTVDKATTGGAYEKVGKEDPTWGGVPITFPRVQGADVVGIVVACGPEADTSLIGKRVMTDNWLRDWDDPLNTDKTGYYGSECDGGFAQYTKIDFRNVAAVDSPLTDAELATFSCSYTTAEGMLNRANVGTGDRVLITGASGGVGSALIQLAKRRGAYVIAMTSEAKHEGVRSLSPDAILPRDPVELIAALKAATGFDSVSVVADIVGGDYFPTLIDALARGGRYTCSGAIARPIVSLDLRTFYLRDLTFTGSTVIPPHVFADLVDYIEAGEVRPLLAATYPLAELHEAQQAFIAKKQIGNIVVIP
ncbi:MAG: alcohol dehydrogenase [Gammaproteobacteria bacterium]|nr:MAG: alcohol dehydrogenase [Gammaproteobacteria bacterium]